MLLHTLRSIPFWQSWASVTIRNAWRIVSTGRFARHWEK